MPRQNVRKLALTGILLSLAVALSWLEGLIPIPSPVPGIKLGLSNTVTMYALFFLGGAPAFAVALLKSGFVMLTRGATAGMLSAVGGLLSVAAMLLAKRLGCSPGMTSVLGAIAHNIGQLAMSSLMLKSTLALWYLPVLVLSGIAMGIVTGGVLKLLLPALQKTGVPVMDDYTNKTNRSAQK
ncbi:MAG: Gx transporter family protein [Oscillospiraceae bacterium]